MEDLVRERQNQLLSFKAITNGFVARLHLHKTGYQEERAALQNEPAGRGGAICIGAGSEAAPYPDKASTELPRQPSAAHFPKLNFWLLSLKNIFSEREREREKGGQLCQRMFCLSPLGLGYGFNMRFP